MRRLALCAYVVALMLRWRKAPCERAAATLMLPRARWHDGASDIDDALRHAPIYACTALSAADDMPPRRLGLFAAVAPPCY